LVFHSSLIDFPPLRPAKYTSAPRFTLRSFARPPQRRYAAAVLRLVFGIVLGAALATGAGWLYINHTKDCVGRCGEGTRCFTGRCIAAGPATSVATTPTHGKPKRRSTAGGPAQAELKLAPGDERITSSGDALGRPEHIDFTQGGDDGKELDQDQIDEVFHGAQSAITRCITEAVGDYPLDSGKVTVRLRIERAGDVKKMRLDAPQLLMRRGLYACVRPAVTKLRFPASGGANVVEYPFALQ
jgi:hypothetical protein